MVIVKSFWGDKEFDKKLLEIPDEHYRMLIQKGYSKEVGELIQLRNAVRDKLTIIPPEERELFIEKLRKIGLLEE
ncbi:hypothetical protein [Persephonella sp.]